MHVGALSVSTQKRPTLHRARLQGVGAMLLLLLLLLLSSDLIMFMQAASVSLSGHTGHIRQPAPGQARIGAPNDAKQRRRDTKKLAQAAVLKADQSSAFGCRKTRTTQTAQQIGI